MKTILTALALSIVGALAQNLTINTPGSVVACQPNLITWSGGTPPYFLSALPGAAPNGAALEDITQTNGTSFTWTCNIAPGTFIDLTLRDSTGTIAQTAPFSINAGTSTSCVNVTGPTGPASSSGSTASTPGATTSSASSGATTASSASSSPTSTGSSAASANVAQFGVAGIVGAAVAALFL